MQILPPSPAPPTQPATTPTFALSISGVPGPTPAAAAAGEELSPTAQQLHSLQPHATVRDPHMSRVDQLEQRI